jgi:hypothetical protein
VGPTRTELELGIRRLRARQRAVGIERKRELEGADALDLRLDAQVFTIMAAVPSA